MSFLRVLGLGAVFVGLRGQRLRAELAQDDLAHFGHRVVGEVSRVGTHITDQTDRLTITQRHAFVEFLGDTHGATGRESELARRFLLQG